MPVTRINGIQLGYDVRGEGPLVVLVMGQGGTGRVWQLHQVPALVRAGYRAATFDNRGIGASEPGPAALTMADMVADTAALVEHLGGGPAHLVGTSLGSRVVVELSLARPELVARAVLLAGHGRLDVTQIRLSAGERALYDAGITLPPTYRAALTALQNLSPHTRADETAVRDWLDVFALADPAHAPGLRAQQALADLPDRLAAYRAVAVPTLVVGFADDQMIPPYLGRELAATIPGAEYAEVTDCGHFGYLERPAEVNALLLDFLAA